MQYPVFSEKVFNFYIVDSFFIERRVSFILFSCSNNCLVLWLDIFKPKSYFFVEEN